MYQKILVPLDGSEMAESVLPHVQMLAEGCRTKEIVLLRICEPLSVLADYPASMPLTWEEHAKQITAYTQQQCSLYLGDIEKKLKDAGLNVKSDARLGKAADAIVSYAAENEIDLIIMASHGRSGPSRWTYGSVADKVLRSTCVPIMIIRAPGCVPGF